MIRTNKGFSIIEVLGGLAIISMISLASAAISLQVLKTSKKSKTISLGIALESAFLEALENPQQPGYKIGSGGTGVTDRLRSGNPPSEVQLWSNFGSVNTAMADRTLLYRLKLDGTVPEALYVNAQGEIVTAAAPWVLKLVASYKQIPAGTDSLPQYSVAYAISGNNVDADFRNFGMGALPFTEEDYFFPLSQTVYSGNENYHENQRPGDCGVDRRKIVSIYSVDLQTGTTRCVIKGNECGDYQLSTGLEVHAPPGEHVSLDLTCRNINKCSCKHIDPKNWVVVGFNPSQVLLEPGEDCGLCEFAFAKTIPAEGVPTQPGTGRIELGVCPGEKYDVTDVRCESEVVNANYVGPAPTAANPNPCPGNPEGSRESFSGAPRAGGRALCERDEANDGCWRYFYNVKITAATCNLQAEYQGQRPARVRGRDSE